MIADLEEGGNHVGVHRVYGHPWLRALHRALLDEAEAEVEIESKLRVAVLVAAGYNQTRSQADSDSRSVTSEWRSGSSSEWRLTFEVASDASGEEIKITGRRRADGQSTEPPR